MILSYNDILQSQHLLHNTECHHSEKLIITIQVQHPALYPILIDDAKASQSSAEQKKKHKE